jgi:hypothetical protein
MKKSITRVAAAVLAASLLALSPKKAVKESHRQNNAS